MFLVEPNASLVVLLAELAFDLGPLFSPASRAEDIAQGQHGIDMLVRPMHARTFQACLHHQLVAAFDNAAANGPTLGLKDRILHLGCCFFKSARWLVMT
jgi:hypothetical protein